ncbi:MAG: MvaI/BcnI family restriction endonuclease [Dehalococcoidales bacterium]|nr:MvaI/BcnI family restriction endonuclease [Dehalococcoidales bacterium]
MPEPPKTKNELFSRMLAIIKHGSYKMPAKYKGTGAPGTYLEDLLGLTSGNKDVPDSVGWEVKYYTTKTNLLTLFHKEPQPADAIHYMVTNWGWKDKQGRMSFRHTIAGKSDRFKVDTHGDQIFIHHLGGKGVVPHWTHDDILNAAVGKLRRLIAVLGTCKGQNATYIRADCYEDLQFSAFMFEVTRGIIKIDFDAREMKPGSKGLRNHGTKFRISPDDICRLYAKKQRLV